MGFEGASVASLSTVVPPPFLGIWMEMRSVSSGVFLFDPLEVGSSTISCERGSGTAFAWQRFFFSLAFKIKTWS
ncbi:hypothetical protein A2U01_0081313 [Trifolium medium]|uniref:Uncharacterized protein n=1 Tax=Trifolium medium TaxID=97028 RepID=A0A392TGB8_9FABA|nr:hypothetical protein [Trifolium medium]